MPFSFQKKFQMNDQGRFAEVSGDWNPMHMDPLAARRTQMGAPVVHGMHTVLECLDQFARTADDPPGLSGITVSFLRPVYVGDLVIFTIARQSPLLLAAEVAGSKVMTVDLTSGPSINTTAGQRDSQTAPPISAIPRERSFDELEKAAGTQGRVPIFGLPGTLFPNASHWLGTNRVNGLAALSTLVGMECPGLHSIFIGFSLTLVNDGPTEDIEYSVLSADERFRRVKLAVSGGGLKGVVDAAVRKPPVLQPSLAEIASRIEPGIFTGQKVLVVGGSRGIGEYVAKAIVAGGGQVAVTYAVGLNEGLALMAEIKAFGGEGLLLPYDVRLPSDAQLEKLSFPPTHVYYFATGRIFGHPHNEYNPSLYQEFRQFYVDGFYDLCSALRKRAERFSVFYPSSVAVGPEERPKGMAEYAKAKADGEALCADMKRLLPGVDVTVKRLPRLPTDQTATLVPVTGEESMHVLLPMILEMQTGH